jgi:hypothetical protein
LLALLPLILLAALLLIHQLEPQLWQQRRERMMILILSPLVMKRFPRMGPASLLPSEPQ